VRGGGRVLTLAFAGVTLRVRFFEVRNRELRVVLQGVEVLVAEAFLDVPQVRAAADQIGRATAAEGMRRDRDRQREAVAVPAHAFEERVKGQALARAREPQRAFGGVAHEERPHAAQVYLNGGPNAALAGSNHTF
jgi:hypothetical protein